jgi:hypothetical protein
MKLIDDSPEELPPLAALGPPGPYRTVPVQQVLGLATASRKGPARIRLSLEGGYELDIPVTQDAIDELFDVLRSVARSRR